MKYTSKFIFFTAFFFLLTLSVDYPAQGLPRVDASEYRLMKTVRFDLYYPVGMEARAFRIASAAEKAYITAASYFRHDLSRVLPIFIYDGKEPHTGSLAKQAYYSFLNCQILVSADEREPYETIMMQMTYAFEYNILLHDKSGGLMNRNSCGLVDKWFLTGMAEYLSAPAYKRNEQAVFALLEENYGKEIFGELLRDARDSGSMKQALLINTGKDNINDIVSDNIQKNNTDEDIPAETIFNFHETLFSPYAGSLSLTEMRAGFAAASANVYAASALMRISDELDVFSIMLYAGLVQDGNKSSPEFLLGAEYGRSKARLCGKLYAKKNPFSAPVIYPDLPQKRAVSAPGFGFDSMYDYGSSLGIKWAFASFLDAELGAKLHYYETSSADEPGIQSTLAEPYIGLNLGVSGGLSSFLKGGISGSLSASRASSFSGENVSYYKLEASLEHYLIISGLHSFTLSAFYGRILDDDKNCLNYYAGGLESLQARSLGRYQGKHLFIVSPEFDYTLVKRVKTGGILPRSVSAVGLAAFVDAAVIDENEKGIRGIADGGLGMRLVFYPSVILKLDFVLPLQSVTRDDYKLYFNLGMSF